MLDKIPLVGARLADMAKRSGFPAVSWASRHRHVMPPKVTSKDARATHAKKNWTTVTAAAGAVDRANSDAADRLNTATRKESAMVFH